MSAGQPLAALVPHAGSMCLLDSVVSWDARRIVCRTASHRRPDHPLSREGWLGAVHLLEYAAQATAVHGTLVADAADGPVVRYLGGVRDCDLHVSRVDDVAADLHVEAERLMWMNGNALYRFRVSADGRALAEGRLSIVAPAEAAR